MVDKGLSDKFPSEKDSSIELPAVFADPKVAIGKVFKLDNSSIPPTEAEKAVIYEDDSEIAAQIKIFEAARLATLTTYEEYLDYADEHALYEVRDIAVESLKAELALIEDSGTEKKIKKLIQDGHSAAYAVDSVYQDNINRFLSIPADNFRKMATELQQHRAVMQHHLNKSPLSTLSNMPEGSVLVTETLTLDCLSHLADPETGEKRIEGIIVKEGSMHSHAAILAQALGIPYARLSEEDFDNLGPSNLVIMDGAQEKVHLSPSKALRAKYAEGQQRFAEQAKALAEKWHSENSSETMDGEKVNVHVNYAMSHEAAKIRSVNPRGVGLYRTELYMDARANATQTSVHKHMEIMKHSMHVCDPNEGVDGFIPMTVRTIDLQGDKSALSEKERAKKEIAITRDQFQAIALLKHELRKMDDQFNPGDDVYERKLRVMIPNTRNVEHFEFMQGMMDEAAEEAGVASVKLGTMAENPFVAYHLPNMDVDFISIGSNDAWHFGSGVNRYGGSSNALYDATEPAFLDYIERVVDIGSEKGVKVSLCGNVASEVECLPLLIGSGLRDISAGAAQVDILKELVSRIDVDAAESLVEKIKQTKTRAERETILADFNQEHLGLEPDGTLDMEGFDTQTPSKRAQVDKGVTEDHDDSRPG